MPRKVVEKPFNGGQWTNARFWSFIRSNLRLMSRKWPPIQEVLRDVRRPSKSRNKRLRWEYVCCECGKWFPRKEVQVEHTIPCGSLKSFDDVAKFLERMLVEKHGLSVQCKGCHQLKTNRERAERENR